MKPSLYQFLVAASAAVAGLQAGIVNLPLGDGYKTILALVVGFLATFFATLVKPPTEG